MAERRVFLTAHFFSLLAVDRQKKKGADEPLTAQEYAILYSEPETQVQKPHQ